VAKLHERRTLRASAKSEKTTVEPASDIPVEVSVMAYGPKELHDETLLDLDKIKEFIGQWPVVWINVDGHGDHDFIKRLGDIFDLHHLAVEDVINVNQRSKVEEYEDNHFIVTRMVEYNGRLNTEQLSIFLGANIVITFSEFPGGDSLNPVRDRLRKNRGYIRDRGADYLVYSIIDAVIDAYFPVLEEYGELMEELEDEIIERPSKHVITEMHSIKRELLDLRRAIWPLRDVTNSLVRDVTPLIKDDTRLYLRDCYDHTVRLIDLLETYRELGADLMDVYLSSVSNKLNEVMKVLTIITTLFIPPTFIAGVYGMNFNWERSPWNMPELNWYFGYPFAWALMIGIVLYMFLFIKRHGWLEPAELDEKGPPQ
jgi:magnesium transporter